MPAYKGKDGTWFVVMRSRNWSGESRQTTKRGFRTKKEALEYESICKMKDKSSLDLPFSAFVELYRKDKGMRIRENTWNMKNSIIDDKLMPFFGRIPINSITPRDVMNWQNKMIEYRDENGKPYSPTYLKTMHNQLSAILNHAVRYYDLHSNPAAKVGNMGKGKSQEMLFWTKEEYLKFSEAVMDKPLVYYSFEMLYWCGIRVGELLALTRKDIDLDRKTLSVTKSFQRINRRDVITPPKTEKSVRTIVMPDFLCEELREFIDSIYGIRDSDRLFPVSKSWLHREIVRGCKATGVKQIRVHDLRHSHVSLLINMGFSAVAIGSRVGHESVDITYRYAHMFPTEQTNMANKLDSERREAECLTRTATTTTDSVAEQSLSGSAPRNTT